MFKNLLFLHIGVFFGISVYGQVGVNTQYPKATLDVVASPNENFLIDGLIAPRLKGDELKSKDDLYNFDQIGAIVYAIEAANPTTPKTINVTSKGYYYFDGTVWIKFIGSNPTDLIEPWNVANTTNPATLNNQNIYQMGRVGINTENPLAQLHINQIREEEAPEEDFLYDGYYTTYGRTELKQVGLTTSKSYRGANFGMVLPIANNSIYNTTLIGARIGLDLLGSSKVNNDYGVIGQSLFTRLGGTTEFTGRRGSGLRNSIQFRESAKLSGAFSVTDNVMDWSTSVAGGELYMVRNTLQLKGTGAIDKLYINSATTEATTEDIKTPVKELYVNYVNSSFNTLNSLKKFAYYNASNLPMYTTNAFRGGTLHSTEANDVSKMGIRSFAFGSSNRIPTESGFAFGNNNVTSSDYTYFYGNGNTVASNNAAHVFVKGLNNKILEGTDAKYATIFGVGNEISGANSAYTLISGNLNVVTGSTRSFITGSNNKAFNDIGAFIMGIDNTIENGVNSPSGKSNNSFAFGTNNKISGSSAIAIGTNNHANWQRSYIIDLDNVTTALNSTAIGTGLRTGSSFEVVLGRYNAITTGNPTSTTTMTDPILQIGNGTSDTERKNAMTIYKNGNIQIANLPVYTDDDAADTDANLPSGALYKLSTGRGVFQKP